MKKTLFAFFAVALLFSAASCQQEIKEEVSDNALKTILVTVANPDTRLALTEGATVVTPSFTTNDVIFGFTGTTTYAYKCTAAGTDTTPAEFTLSSTTAPSADQGTVLTLFFAPGYDETSIVDGKLAIDITAQKAATAAELPIVMTAQATVDAAGSCKAEFTNRTSIIDVKDAVLTNAAEGTAISSFKASGLCGKMEFSLASDGTLQASAATATDEISNTSVAAVAAGSKVSACLATFPTPAAGDVVFTATDANAVAYTYTAAGKTVGASQYIKVSGKTFSAGAAPEPGTILISSFEEFSAAVLVTWSATENVTLKLVADVDIDDDSIDLTNENEKAVTLDLNGHVLSSSRTMVLSTYGLLNVVDSSTGKTGKIHAEQPGFLKAISTGTINITECYLETACIDASLSSQNGMVIVEGDDNKLATVNITGCMLKAVGDYGTTLIGSKNGNVNIESSTLINSFVTPGEGYYCLLTAGGNTVSISNSFLISECRNVIISGSGTYYTVENSYFYSETGKPLQSSSNKTYDKNVTFNSAWFNKDIKEGGSANGAMVNWVVPEGKEYVAVPAVTKTIDGKEYQFNWAVKNK